MMSNCNNRYEVMKTAVDGSMVYSTISDLG